METTNIFTESGILITITLIAIPIIVASILLVLKSYSIIRKQKYEKSKKDYNEYISSLSAKELEELEKRQAEIDFELTHQELEGNAEAVDKKGLLHNIKDVNELRFVEKKKKKYIYCREKRIYFQKEKISYTFPIIFLFSYYFLIIFYYFLLFFLIIVWDFCYFTSC